MPKFKPEKPNDDRNYCVLPIKATIDKRLVKHAAAYRLLARICTYTDNVGVTFVSQDRLAADLDVSRQAINKQMRLLREFGYVVYARKRYAQQKTNSIKVIYDDDVITEQEAYSNLTPLQQMEQAERQARERLHNDKVKLPGVAATSKVAAQVPGETSRGLQQVKPPEVARHETSRGCTKRTINDTNITYKENIKVMLNEFCRQADQMGTPRILNERDTALMTSWIDNGLTLITWRSILGKHVQYCRDNNREIARSLGYFVTPVNAALQKIGSPKIKAMVNQLVRDKKM